MIDLDNEHEYRWLIDNFYLPYDSTLYGEMLKKIGKELNRVDTPLKYSDCVQQFLRPFAFNITYCMDLYEVMLHWSNSRTWQLC